MNDLEPNRGNYGIKLKEIVMNQIFTFSKKEVRYTSLK